MKFKIIIIEYSFQCKSTDEKELNYSLGITFCLIKVQSWYFLSLALIANVHMLILICKEILQIYL